eukprot:2193023-Amphidinium_carterae.1
MGDRGGEEVHFSGKVLKEHGSFMSAMQPKHPYTIQSATHTIDKTAATSVDHGYNGWQMMTSDDK